MVTDKNFEKALTDSNNQRVMNKVAGKYINSIEYDELESEKLIVLWECLKTYDPSRKKKFTSFLYQKLDWRYKKILRERKRRSPTFCDNIDLKNSRDGLDVEKRVISHTDGLPEHLKNVVIQYYLHNMTIEEIGRENHYSRETARRLIKKALSKIKYCWQEN